MSWKKKDPYTGVEVEIDDDLTAKEAEQLLAADADGSERRGDHPEEAGR